MKSLNLAITLCMYFTRLEGLLSLPSSQPNQDGKLDKKAWNGLKGLGGSGLSGLGGNFLGSGGSGNGGTGLGAVSDILGGSSVDNSGEGGCSKYKIISARGTGENQVTAMVVTQTMNKISIPSSSIAAIVLYGNPYFKGGAPQNACSAKSGAGDAAATGIQMPAKYSLVTFDCCLTGDMICQTTGSIVAHLAYPGSASEKEAVRFTASKLKEDLDGNRSSKPDDSEDGDKESHRAGDATPNQGTTQGGNGFRSGSGSGSNTGMGGLPSLGSGMSGLPSMGSGTGDSNGISSLFGAGGNGGVGGLPSFGGSSSGMGGLPSFGGAGIPGISSLGSGSMSAKSEDTV